MSSARCGSGAPKAKVLVVGYPQIISADNRCASLPLAAGDYAYGEKINLRDDRGAPVGREGDRVDVRRRVGSEPGPRHLLRRPVDQRRGTDQKRAAAYHPFAAEQVAVADLVVDAARD